MHWFSENGEKVQKEIPRPPAVHSYNLYMGAVDMFDQYRSYVNVEIRSRKFWHPIFWFMVESALINSWLLYKATRVLSLLPLQYNLFTFRKSIALALAAHWEKMGCRNKSMMHSNSQIRVHLRKLNFDDEIRFTGTDLHVSQFEPIPLKQGSKLKVRQMLPALQKEKNQLLVQTVQETIVQRCVFLKLPHQTCLSSCKKRMMKRVFLATV